MRARICVLLIALATSPAISMAADAPDAGSAQTKRERFMNGSDPPTPPSTPDTQSSNNSTPNQRYQVAPSADVQAPPSSSQLTPYQLWLTSLQQMSQGGWQYVTTGESDSDANVLFVSTHHIMVNGTVVTAWFRWEYQTDMTYGLDTFRSIVTRDRIDCARDVDMTISQTIYSKQNMEGTATSQISDQRTAKWEPIIPGSLGEAELNWACNKVLKNSQHRNAR